MERVKFLFRFLRYFPQTVYFNFKFLRPKDAIKFPILLYKPRFGKLTGRIEIRNKNIHFGMIRLGYPGNNLYSGKGIFIEIAGDGKMIFEGETFFGNDCGISVGTKGQLIIGNDVFARVGVKICAYHYVKIGERTRIAWNTTIMDSSFHSLKDASTAERLSAKPYGPIIIGKENWLGSGCLILKGAWTNDNVILGARSVLSKKLESEPNCIAVGTPPKVVKKGVYRDMDDCGVDYEWYEESE